MNNTVFSMAGFVLAFIASIIIVPVGKIVRVESPDRSRITETFVSDEKSARVLPILSGSAILVQGVSPGITRIEYKSAKKLESQVWIVVPKQ